MQLNVHKNPPMSTLLVKISVSTRPTQCTLETVWIDKSQKQRSFCFANLKRIRINYCCWRRARLHRV